MNKFGVDKLKVISAALGAAIADRETELSTSCRTVVYFDTDVILGGIFAFKTMKELWERAVEAAHSASSANATPNITPLIFDYHLVQCLWHMGHFGRIRMLSPHVLELAERAPYLAGHATATPKQVDDVAAASNLTEILYLYKSASASAELEPKEITLLVESVFRRVRFQQFVALDAVTLPHWEQRRLRAKKWLDLPHTPEDHILDLAEIARTWEICDELSISRDETRLTDRTFVDAAALVALARPRDPRPDEGPNDLHRLHTQTGKVLETVSRLWRDGTREIGCDDDSMWDQSGFGDRAAIRGSEYMLLRTLHSCLQIDRVEQRTPEKIARHFAQIADLKTWRERIRDCIRGVESRDSNVSRRHLAQADRLLTDVYDDAFERSVLLDERHLASNEFSSRTSIWGTVFKTLTEHEEILRAVLPDLDHDGYNREVSLMKAAHDPVDIIRRVVSSRIGAKLPSSSLLADCGIVRWCGGLGVNIVSDPKTELSGLCRIVDDLFGSNALSRDQRLTSIREGLLFKDMREYVIESATSSTEACALMWMFGGRAELGSRLDTAFSGFSNGQFKAEPSRAEKLGFEIMHHACWATRGRLRFTPAIIKEERSRIEQLMKSISELANEGILPPLNAAMMYCGIAWVCFYLYDQSERGGILTESMTDYSFFFTLGLQASQSCWDTNELGDASCGTMGLQAVNAACALLLTSHSPKAPESLAWVKRADEMSKLYPNNMWLLDATMWHQTMESGMLLSRAGSRTAERALMIEALMPTATVPLEPHQLWHRSVWTAMAKKHSPLNPPDPTQP